VKSAAQGQLEQKAVGESRGWLSDTVSLSHQYKEQGEM